MLILAATQDGLLLGKLEPSRDSSSLPIICSVCMDLVAL
jgi:hypothetical protein